MPTSLAIYFQNQTVITVLVMAFLSFYFIAVLWVLFYRYFYLSSWLEREKGSAQLILKGSFSAPSSSMLSRCEQYSERLCEKSLSGCIRAAEKESTVGLTLLSIIASTSPFVGLFGTVVSILHSFAKIGEGGSMTLQIMAPAIGEALVATAAGIFVAIPAYAAHLILKRKAYEILTYLNMQADLLLARNNSFS